MKIYFFNKIQNMIGNLFILSHFYYYKYSKQSIYKKIKKIDTYNENHISIKSEDQEEQALPGMKKYKENGWDKYMYARYLYSIKHIKEKSVLDTGCGLGWGSYLISDFPKNLISIDIDKNSLTFAEKTWNSKKINFINNSMIELEKLKTNFDIILGFETIEHLLYSDGEEYIKSISNVLHKNGVLILSSYFPYLEKNAKIAESSNFYHHHIFTKNEIFDILSKFNFIKIKFFGNYIVKAVKQ